ncbi:MAG TPA: hypothetical protein VFV38_27255 [Ktedonobacteraceae bacterium]|nr:hypothetical protein [Ktedonobacteraceae bacterium]
MSFQPSDPVLVCNSTAIPKEVRPLHQANTKRIFSSVQEVRELETGYALRIADEADLLQTVVTFLCYERLCCPFFHFTLEMEPDQGPVWLHMTGVTDVKAFLRKEGFASPVPLSPHRESEEDQGS